MGDRGEACRDSAMAQASGNLSANGLERTRVGEEGEERRLVGSSGRLLPAALGQPMWSPQPPPSPRAGTARYLHSYPVDQASGALQRGM